LFLFLHLIKIVGIPHNLRQLYGCEDGRGIVLEVSLPLLVLCSEGELLMSFDRHLIFGFQHDLFLSDCLDLGLLLLVRSIMHRVHFMDRLCFVHLRQVFYFLDIENALSVEEGSVVPLLLLLAVVLLPLLRFKLLGLLSQPLVEGNHMRGFPLLLLLRHLQLLLGVHSLDVDLVVLLLLDLDAFVVQLLHLVHQQNLPCVEQMRMRPVFSLLFHLLLILSFNVIKHHI